jgi:hypothetical protein
LSLKILGGGTELISTDDKAKDTLDRERFVQKYQEMHPWVRESGGIATLYIGAENWPFPTPLVSRNGAWRFNSKTGSDEILFRRIGENEVTAIGMCDTMLTAETHPETNSEADRLVDTLLPHVRNANKPITFHGNYFHILPSSSGGFAAIAYPAVYRSSGVMTFIVTQGVGVSEKDLGPNMAKPRRLNERARWLQLDDSAPERESDGVGPISSAQFSENACHVPFDRVFVDREFDSDSLVRIAGCRE